MELIIPAKPEPVKIDPVRTGLVVVDMQNAFCSKGGMFDLMGMLNETRVMQVVEKDKKVIEAFRQKDLKIIYLRMGYRPDLADAGGPESPNYWKEGSLSARREHPELGDKHLTIGSWDWEIIDELKPLTEDLLVNKNRFSAFPNTNFDIVLRTHNLKYLVFIGLFTNVCVESTIRDAFFHEYFPILVSDACGNMGPKYTQDATIYTVSHVFGWVTTTLDIEKALCGD
jgi:ureidoacrylate peracid hydrolase